MSRTVADLRNTIETTKYGTSGTVKATVERVYKFLTSASHDQQRDFFRECYFPFVGAVYGLNTTGMLASIGSRPVEIDALVNFLRPSGTFFQSVLEADAEQLHRFKLPTQYLSVHTQALLASRDGACRCRLVLPCGCARSSARALCRAAQAITTMQEWHTHGANEGASLLCLGCPGCALCIAHNGFCRAFAALHHCVWSPA